MFYSQVSLDVLLLILEQVRSASLEDLKAVSLCNKEIYHVSLPFLYHALSVDQGHKEKARLTWTKLESDQGLQGYVKELTLSKSRAPGRASASADDAPEESGIGRLLEIASQEGSRLRLRTFTWHVTEHVDLAPLARFNHILPNCTVSLQGYTGKRIPFIRNLVSLDSTVHLSSNPLERFSAVFAKAPTLQRLHIRVYRPSGCVATRFFTPKFLMANTPRATLPKLHDLSLKGFLSLHNPDPHTGLFDWSRLHTLRLDCCSYYGTFLESICSQLTSLRSLSVHLKATRTGGDDYSAVSSVLQCFPHSLKELDLAGPYLPLLDTIGRYQGQSLRKLSLHMPEAYRHEQRQVMNTSQFQTLAGACRTLECLQVDVEKGDEFATLDFDNKELHNTRVGSTSVAIVEGCDLTFSSVHSILTSHGTMPNLRSLCLYTLLGIRQCTLAITREEMSSRMLPFLDFFPLIASFSVIQGELRQMGGGYPARWVLWERSTRRAFHFCKESENTVKATDGKFWSAEDTQSQPGTIYQQEHGKWSVKTTFADGDAERVRGYLVPGTPVNARKDLPEPPWRVV